MALPRAVDNSVAGNSGHRRQSFDPASRAGRPMDRMEYREKPMLPLIPGQAKPTGQTVLSSNVVISLIQCSTTENESGRLFQAATSSFRHIAGLKLLLNISHACPDRTLEVHIAR